MEEKPELRYTHCGELYLEGIIGTALHTSALAGRSEPCSSTVSHIVLQRQQGVNTIVSMNPVLLIHAFMAAFLILFRQKLDDGSFGMGSPRTIDSGSIQRNRTYALAIYKPHVVVPGLPLEIDYSEVSKLFETSVYRWEKIPLGSR